MSEEISREDMGDKLLDATRNNYEAQINNIWHIIHRVELTDEERDEVFTCMAWIEEDLENFHYIRNTADVFAPRSTRDILNEQN